MDGTTLEYNGIKFLNVYTKSMSHEVVRDDTDRDVIGIKVRIDIDGCIQNDQGTPFIEPGSEVGGEMLKKIRAKLMTPRQDLKYSTGEAGHVLKVDGMLHYGDWASNAGETQPNYDINNGPRPISLTVKRVVAGTASWFDVEYSIETTVVLSLAEGTLTGGTSQQAGSPTQPLSLIGKSCRGLHSMAKALVSNKWQTSQTIDNRKYSKLVYDGTLQLMSAAKRSSEDFSVLINALMPPLMQGFSRDTVDYSLSKDGMKVNYRIVDTERYAAPPQPATNWSGQVSVQTRENGTTVHIGCSLTMEGGPGTHPYQLLQRSMRIAELKMGKFKTNASFILKSLSFTENLHDNTIHLSVQAERTGRDGNTPADIFKTYYNNVGNTLDKNQKLGSHSAGKLSGYDPKSHPIGPVLMRSGHGQDQGYPFLADAFRNAFSGLNASVPVLSYEGSARTASPFYKEGKKQQTKVSETTSQQPGAGDNIATDEFVNPKPPGIDNVSITMSRVKTHYENKSGMIPLPRAVSATKYNTRPVQFVKICQPSTVKVVTIDLSSFQTWPVVPTPADTIKLINTGEGSDINIYLIDSNVELHGPQKKGNALEFRIKATYRFATDKTLESVTAQPEAYVAVGDPSVVMDQEHRVVKTNALPPSGGTTAAGDKGGGGGW